MHDRIILIIENQFVASFCCSLSAFQFIAMEATPAEISSQYFPILFSSRLFCCSVLFQCFYQFQMCFYLFDSHFQFLRTPCSSVCCFIGWNYGLMDGLSYLPLRRRRITIVLCIISFWVILHCSYGSY